MARIGRITLLAGCALALAVPALADGVLEIQAAAGDTTATQSLAVESWSFGATNQSSAPPTASGRQAAAPTVGDEVTVAVRYGSAPTRAAAGAPQNAGRVAGDCVKGQHIKQATLKIDGRVYVLGDVVVADCAAAAAKGDPLKGMLKGHVTLIK